MSKEFQKKYMHPTRRKLANMVATGGEYEKESFVSFAQTESNRKREIGEVWTDSDGKKWEQKEFGRVRINENSDTFAEVREYLNKLNTCSAKDCNTIKVSQADKKLISKTGYCAKCLAKKELQIKQDGLWEAYTDYRSFQNMIAYGKEVIAQFQQAYKDVKQEYEIVGEDGKLEKWKMEKDAEEMKAEILADIKNFEEELEIAYQKRNEAWDKLKDKNYDLVKAPID
jgi:hypothetical protein